MYCNKCGVKVSDDAEKCTACGNVFNKMKNRTNANDTTQKEFLNNSSATNAENEASKDFLSQSQKKPMGCGVKILIGLVCAGVIGIIAIVLIVIGIMNSGSDYVEIDNNNNSSTQNTSGNNQNGNTSGNGNSQPAPVVNTVKQFDVDKLRDAIVSNSWESYVSVAVYDNKSGEIYASDDAYSAYPAWGFYLPIYLMNPSSSYSKNIMSNDPGVCNSAANRAINDMGGTTAVTAALQNAYSVSATSYGRKFGDTKSSQENYTCAVDAAMMLSKLNGLGERELLSYNYTKFGIDVPDSANAYAQVGTENINAKKNLNIFAIVKGGRSDYCIAVLTRGGVGSTAIDYIMEVVHNEMESL